MVVQASRVRKEATPAQIAEELAVAGRLPVLLVTGACDRLASPAFVARLAEQIRGQTERVVIPGCGHLSNEEAAGELLSHLAPFLVSLNAHA